MRVSTQRMATGNNGTTGNGASGWLRRASAAIVAAGVALTGVSGLAVARADDTKQVAAQDELIFKDGRRLVGKIVAETASTITFSGRAAGIAFKTDYQKTDILEIKRAASATPAAPKPAGGTPGGTPATPPTGTAAKTTTAAKSTSTTPATASPTSENADGKQRYMIIELDGVFGEDITQTPIWEAIENARDNKVDVLIFKINAEFFRDELKLSELPDDAANVNELRRAEEIAPLFISRIPAEWGPNQPRVAFWVDSAMAGAALLPFCAKEIYFTSDGRMGGLGNLEFLYNQGDSVVHQKWMSAMMGHAQGWTIAGGYDPRIIQAMAVRSYVLSATFQGDKAVLLERMPEGPHEELLTDDGKDANQDGLMQRVRGEGNDVLTLNADVALRLGISKGTADTREQLLFEMGLDRAGVPVEGRGQKIMENWSRRLREAKRELVNLLREYGEVEVRPPAEWAQRNAARNERLNIIKRMRTLMRQFDEGLSPRWRWQNNIPAEADLESLVKQIEIEALRDPRR
ncbi:MAG: hypothetical protein SFZ23_04945 [Planctomycetota bacterium]|nr:hypothetical protein [Planctomycetota bacterium]